MLLFCVEIIVVATNVVVLGWLKEEEEEVEEEEERRKSKFRPMLTCSSRKLCVNVIPILDHKSIR